MPWFQIRFTFVTFSLSGAFFSLCRTWIFLQKWVSWFLKLASSLHDKFTPASLLFLSSWRSSFRCLRKNRKFSQVIISIRFWTIYSRKQFLWPKNCKFLSLIPFCWLTSQFPFPFIKTIWLYMQHKQFMEMTERHC